MFRKTAVTMALSAALLAGGTAAGTAAAASATAATSAVPAAVAPYHSDLTQIHPAGHKLLCLEATSPHPGAAVFIGGCKNGDGLQLWTGIQIGGVLLLWLSADPDICVAGQAGDDAGRAVTYDCSHRKHLDPRQGLVVTGGVREGAANGIKNTAGRWLSCFNGAGPAQWLKRGTKINGRSANRGLVFAKGWTRHVPVP
jgi:hypothetical protein